MAEQERKNMWTGVNLIYTVGCICLIIASFLPYIYSDEKNITLMEGMDGIFFLGFSILIFIFISFDSKKVVGILSLITVYLAAYELMHTYGVLSSNGSAVSLRPGYFLLLVGTLVLLVGAADFVYQNGLKNWLNKMFDKFFPIKSGKE